jgi:hypothetical protein
MNRALGIALIVAGGVLLFFGLRANDSFSSDVSRFFSGHPTDKALWLIVGGAASLLAGVVLTLKRTWRSV